MSSSPRLSVTEANSENNMRKRVCKACDRCRLKKSKCDGASHCSRCRADNAICVFGERKKSHDKAYPKGYVEMLEQQQAQLVAALRELYRRLNAGEDWPGSPLKPDASSGQPLTHDILERLHLLHMQTESHGMTDGFEEDTEAMQNKLIESGASLVRRRGSIISNSDHSHQHELDQHSPLTYDTPSSARSSQFSEAFAGHGTPPTPPSSNTSFPQQARPTDAKPFATNFTQPAQTGPNLSSFVLPQWPMIVNDDTMDSMTYETPIGYDGVMMYQSFANQLMINAIPMMNDLSETIDMDFTDFISSPS